MKSVRAPLASSLVSILWLIATVSPCVAAGPKQELVGYWQFKRGLGGPCASGIRALEYAFLRDGSYEGSAKMSNGVSLKYTGTYSATETMCTVFVDGQTVGPFPYSIKDNLLTIQQPEFGCAVELVREDY